MQPATTKAAARNSPDCFTMPGPLTFAIDHPAFCGPKTGDLRDSLVRPPGRAGKQRVDKNVAFSTQCQPDRLCPGTAAASPHYISGAQKLTEPTHEPSDFSRR